MHLLYLDTFREYTAHPKIDYKNFLCSFNGTDHISRRLLVSILKKFNWWNSDYCSKNFKFLSNHLDGNIDFFVGAESRVYRKFFNGSDSEDFAQSVVTFDYDRSNHGSNIYSLERRLTECFVHLVSESLSTSYYPYYGEKFLYSVVTRGLFVSYGQPRFHEKMQQWYGFKTFDYIFDYKFDTIENPVERLVELVSMLAKFSYLSQADWHDLYNIEKETIEYNYDHYHSGDYIKCLEKFVKYPL
jgi:hypothetical protein